MFEGRHIDYRSSMVDISNHRSSKVDTSVIGLRTSTHPSPKVDSSIFESRHIHLRRSTHRDIDLRRATHRYSKVNTSIFESRRKHHTYNSSSNIAHICAPKSLEWTKLHTLIRTCIKINRVGSCVCCRCRIRILLNSNSNTRVTPHVHWLCIERLFILRICVSRRRN